jgi:hypothetical protein
MRSLTMQRRKTVVIALVIMCLILFLPITGAYPAHAECTFGDIICEIQQAGQQLIDTYIGPLKDWAILQTNALFYGAIYNADKVAASALWSVHKSLIMSGVGIGVIRNWISTNFFQPMLATNNQMLAPMVGSFFIIALGILGCTYFLSSLIQLNVVSPRNMLLWYLSGALFFQLGPTLYRSMDDLRQSLSTYFYAASLDAVKNQSPFQALASGDNAKSSPIYGMSTPCNNFTNVSLGPAGTFDGLDIALAYLKADGVDVIGGGARCLGGGAATDLPRSWYDLDGYFDLSKSPDTWVAPIGAGGLDPILAKIKDAVTQAFAGISRLLNVSPLILFGIIEQLVSLCLVIAEGLTFLSFGCAILFAFFRRTEPIAWALLDQWVGLIIQMMNYSLPVARIRRV